MVKDSRKLNIVIIILTCTVVLLLGAVVFLLLRPASQSKTDSDTPQPAYTQDADYGVVYVNESVPKSTLDDSLFTNENGIMRYGESSRVGVDVSSWQGEIDWQAVKESGIDFAMVQLGYRGYTEGALVADAYFLANVQGAAAAGLDVGVYFFSQAVSETEALEEAEFVISTLGDCGVELTYPVCFDWEPVEAESRTSEIGGEMLTDYAAAFCGRIEREGYDAAVYFNRKQGYFDYDLSRLTDYDFWLANYDSTPAFYYAVDMWQYTHTGTVSGIEGNVDLNVRF